MVRNIGTIISFPQIMKALVKAKANGFSDVLYLDSVHNRYLEEVSTSNVFVVKVISCVFIFLKCVF